MSFPWMWRTLAGVGLSALVVGCDASPRDPSTERNVSSTISASAPPRPGPDPLHTPAPRPQPPRPDLARLSFDASARRLRLYDLPEPSARWMITLPSSPMGVPVDREYQFPPGMDLDVDSVAVFYTMPNNRPSPAVSLREIAEMGARASR